MRESNVGRSGIFSKERIFFGKEIKKNQADSKRISDAKEPSENLWRSQLNSGLFPSKDPSKILSLSLSSKEQLSSGPTKVTKTVARLL